MKHLSVGEVARLLDTKPQPITQLFYEGRLRDDLCPIVGGNRIIPYYYVEMIAKELCRKGIAARFPSQAQNENRNTKSTGGEKRN